MGEGRAAHPCLLAPCRGGGAGPPLGGVPPAPWPSGAAVFTWVPGPRARAAFLGRRPPRSCGETGREELPGARCRLRELESRPNFAPLQYVALPAQSEKAPRSEATPSQPGPAPFWGVGAVLGSYPVGLCVRRWLCGCAPSWVQTARRSVCASSWCRPLLGVRVLGSQVPGLVLTILLSPPSGVNYPPLWAVQAPLFFSASLSSGAAPSPKPGAPAPWVGFFGTSPYCPHLVGCHCPEAEASTPVPGSPCIGASPLPATDPTPSVSAWGTLLWKHPALKTLTV